MLPDLINGSFELGGALATCLSVRRLWRDRRISGVHWAPTIYFTSWGAWNIWYYPTLGQWFSMLGGIAMAAVNLTWLLSLLWLGGWPRRRSSGTVGGSSRGGHRGQ